MSGRAERALVCGTVALAVFVALGVALVVVLFCMAMGDEVSRADGQPGRHASLEEENAIDASGGIVIDACDRKAMHDVGLPAKSDVLAWHMNGRWSFPVGDGEMYEVHIYYDLPGGAWIWDALYGIDPETPAFRFRGDEGDDDEA